MIFQREKKQLWRYASSNSPPTSGAAISQPQLPHHRQPQHRLQMGHHQLLGAHRPHLLHPMTSYADCCVSNSMSPTMSRGRQVSTPPPPYSSIPCGMEYSGDSQTQGRDDEPHGQSTCAHRQQRCPTEMSDDYSKSGCCYERHGGSMAADECDQSNGSSSTTTTTTSTSSVSTAKALKQLRSAMDVPCSPVAPAPAAAVSIMTPQMSSFASTAASVFRNCCGAGCLSSEPRSQSTSAALNLSLTHATTNNNNCYGQGAASQQHAPLTHQISDVDPHNTSYQQQQFSSLMKKLKSRQLTSLLQAVKSFRDPVAPSATRSADGAGVQHLNCILLKRGLSLGEDPYVIVCRLFLWADLRSADELKRLPVCTNARDPVYSCCNPLHWCRILVPETAPPPYQPLSMDRLRNEGAATGESSQNEGNSVTASVRDNNSSSVDIKTGHCVQIPESLTTDGQDRRLSASSVWCEVAYWELAQRVGERYLAEKPVVNIFSEGPRLSGTSSGMCLKDLSDRKSTPSPESVQKTRKKIGLGVTLSQEFDGVWLYNRSTVPIFLHSPTLNDCWFQVCKVMPGYCVRAFDNHRAHEQFPVCPPQVAGAQTGPVDRFSMRISFAKGWGSKYCRQDITACPCWLEVLFTRR